jgi:hypothetical protein
MSYVLRLIIALLFQIKILPKAHGKYPVADEPMHDGGNQDGFVTIIQPSINKAA